jgi:hypothetical protein
MKVIIATLSFILTASGLFFYEKYSSVSNDSSAAAILESLKNKEEPLKSPSSPVNNKSSKSGAILKETPTTTTTTQASPTPNITPAGTQTNSEITTTTESLIETTTTSVQTPAPQPSAIPGHVFYTSHLAYPRSKYIYCDTDKNWKTLSNPNTFSSMEAALGVFPGKLLHEPCK